MKMKQSTDDELEDTLLRSSVDVTVSNAFGAFSFNGRPGQSASLQVKHHTKPLTVPHQPANGAPSLNGARRGRVNKGKVDSVTIEADDSDEGGLVAGPRKKRKCIVVSSQEEATPQPPKQRLVLRLSQTGKSVDGGGQGIKQQEADVVVVGDTPLSQNEEVREVRDGSWKTIKGRRGGVETAAAPQNRRTRAHGVDSDSDLDEYTGGKGGRGKGKVLNTSSQGGRSKEKKSVHIKGKKEKKSSKNLGSKSGRSKKAAGKNKKVSLTDVDSDDDYNADSDDDDDDDDDDFIVNKRRPRPKKKAASSGEDEDDEGEWGDSDGDSETDAEEEDASLGSSGSDKDGDGSEEDVDVALGVDGFPEDETGVIKRGRLRQNAGLQKGVHEQEDRWAANVQNGCSSKDAAAEAHDASDVENLNESIGEGDQGTGKLPTMKAAGAEGERREDDAEVEEEEMDGDGTAAQPIDLLGIRTAAVNLTMEAIKKKRVGVGAARLGSLNQSVGVGAGLVAPGQVNKSERKLSMKGLQEQLRSTFYKKSNANESLAGVDQYRRMGGIPGVGPLGKQGWVPPVRTKDVVDLAEERAKRAEKRCNNQVIGSEDEQDVGDDLEKLLSKCEDIARKLKEMLGAGQQLQDRFAGVDATSVPRALVTHSGLVESCGEIGREFKSYQLVGINFLLMLYLNKIGGAILADDMGLGKTAQTIAFLGALRQLHNEPGPHLVVVPASLLENWERELHRWCPHLKVITFYGADRPVIREQLEGWRQDVQSALLGGFTNKVPPGYRGEGAKTVHVVDDEDDDDDSEKDEGTDEDEDQEEEVHYDDRSLDLPDPCSGEAPFNVLLTCYTLFERNSASCMTDRSFLCKWGWSCMVMDEAHALKNRNSIRASKMRSVAKRCRHRLMLSGTPLQNSLGELLNLLEFLRPDLFQGIPNIDGLLQEQGEMEKQVQRIKTVLGPFVLRRLKTEIADQLVSKTQVVKMVPLAAEQRALYQQCLDDARKEVREVAAQKAPKKRTATAGDGDSAQLVRKLGAQRINNIFTHLRKVAQHPLLVRHQYSEQQLERIIDISVKRQLFSGNCSHKRVRQELETYNDYKLHIFCQSHPKELGSFLLPPTCVMTSGKFQLLSEMLPQLRKEGHKVLLFSQWTSVLDIMEWLLGQLGLTFVRLDGSTAVDVRLTIADQFNSGEEDVFAFLLSTRAGGQGLNLVGADTVILHDVDFNPQIDRQAEDRCHRLGQTRPVTVYRLVSDGTVDQNVYNIAQKKLELDAAVIGSITLGTDDTGGKGKKGGKAADTSLMGQVLANLLMGVESS